MLILNQLKETTKENSFLVFFINSMLEKCQGYQREHFFQYLSIKSLLKILNLCLCVCLFSVKTNFNQKSSSFV